MVSLFEDRLDDARRRVEGALGELLERQAELGVVPQRLMDAARYSLLGGGKRFRPFLVLEAAALFDAPGKRALPVAAALECVHCYSLVHDDLPSMDNDLVRRGQPTVWAKYDDWTAILAGDMLLTWAFEILAAPIDGVSMERQLRLVSELARASGGAGMVGGQMLDLMADKLGEPRVRDRAHVSRLQAMKTGALIEFACRAGGIAAGAADGDVTRLSRYGAALGLAFQISDDLLDVTGDAATVGKAVAKDAALGKATLVSLDGIEGARRLLADTAEDARAALEPYGARAAVLLAAVDYMSTRTS